jgi:hypothetical protein
MFRALVQRQAQFPFPCTVTAAGSVFTSPQKNYVEFSNEMRRLMTAVQFRGLQEDKTKNNVSWRINTREKLCRETQMQTVFLLCIPKKI